MRPQLSLGLNEAIGIEIEEHSPEPAISGAALCLDEQSGTPVFTRRMPDRKLVHDILDSDPSDRRQQ